jgi:hypothetical protein
LPAGDIGRLFTIHFRETGKCDNDALPSGSGLGIVSETFSDWVPGIYGFHQSASTSS